MNEEMQDWIDYIFDQADAEISEWNKNVVESQEKNTKTENQTPQKAQKIRAGKKAGLPSESITTDLFLACLKTPSMFYKKCYLTKKETSHHNQIENILDEDLFSEDLKNISNVQGFMRNGWNSDPSWNWKKALELARLIRNSGRLPIFNTKLYKMPSDKTMKKLASYKAEIRIAISVFDTRMHLKSCFEFVENYRKMGGVSIPILMSAHYNKGVLNRKQTKIVEFIKEKDIIGAEHSIQFPENSPLHKIIDANKCEKKEETKNYWCGRIFSEELKVPTINAIPPYYLGMQNSLLSKNEDAFLNSLWYQKIKTNEEIKLKLD